MTRRLRQLLVLAISLVAFAGMVTVVTVGVITRRHNRDLRFGLEQLDILIEDGRLDESAVMVPWLAHRADTAMEMLSVLKRGVAVFQAGGRADALDEAAQIAVRAFPGNESIRSIGVYAAVKSGDTGRALEWAGDFLVASDPALFAWVLLSSGRSPDPELVAAEGTGLLFLAGLERSDAPAQYERAWRATGDWRYAADAAVLHMQLGEIPAAAVLVNEASIPLRRPVLAADIYRDAGDSAGALAALRSASDSTLAVRTRMADLLMETDRFDEARELYAEMIAESPDLSPVPYLNLAWLSGSQARSRELYDAAVARFPAFWPAVEQRALLIARGNMDEAFASLEDYSGPQPQVFTRLLRLKLEPDMDRRGYEAGVFSLLADRDPPPDAIRYALWYFAGRGQFDEMQRIVEKHALDSGWMHTYRGLLAANAGEWADAVSEFESAYSLRPSWMTAYNTALARLRDGLHEPGMSILSRAAELARETGPVRASSAIYVAMARATRDRQKAYQAARRALELDPTNSQALLIRDLLESGSAY